MIPGEAVEAAAKVLRSQDDELDYPYPVTEYLNDARAILEAAAPHMLVIDDALWHEFQEATATAGTNPSETIRQLIREWVRNNKQGETTND